jgi:hypothetical protein
MFRTHRRTANQLQEGPADSPAATEPGESSQALKLAPMFDRQRCARDYLRRRKAGTESIQLNPRIREGAGI